MQQEQPFRFLDLSAELRNHIYSHAVDGHTKQDRKARKLDFLHLTQACQQIRAEFRPVYMKNTVILILERRLMAYLDAFLPGWDGHDIEKDKLVANICIMYLTDSIENNASFFPVVQLLATAPNIHIRVDPSPFTEQKQLQGIYNLRDQWAELVRDGTIEDVSWTPATTFSEDEDFIQESNLGAFYVRLKKHYAAPWIEYGPEGADISDDSAAVKFLENLGFARWTSRDGFSVWLELQSNVGMDVSSYRKVIDNNLWF